MAMDIYRYDNLQELEVLARNRVATWTFREKKQQPGAPATTKSLPAWQAQQGEGKGEGRKARKRGKARGATLSPQSLFLFPFLPFPSRRLLRRLQSRVFFRLSFMVYIDRVDNRKEKEKQLQLD